MHRAIVPAALVSALVMHGRAAAGAPEDTAPIVTVETSASVSVYGEKRAPGKPPSAKFRPASPAPTPTWTYWIYSFGDEGFCRQRVTTTVEAVADRMRPYATYSMTLPVCAKPPASEGPPPADGLARQFWDVRVLPDPVLRIVPDYAITGKLVYLQISGPKVQHFDVDNPIGDDVAITATSKYVVDWGDGTTTTTVSQGGPWPSGDVTHTYVDAVSSRTITVKQIWTGGWTAGAGRGDLADLQTTASLALSVTQLQAVRNS